LIPNYAISLLGEQWRSTSLQTRHHQVLTPMISSGLVYRKYRTLPWLVFRVGLIASQTENVSARLRFYWQACWEGNMIRTEAMNKLIGMSQPWVNRMDEAAGKQSSHQVFSMTSQLSSLIINHNDDP
jgi:hypothetical protein